MRKLTCVVMAGLAMAATFAQAETLRTRARLVSRTEIQNTDPAADVLRVTQSYPPIAGGALGYEPQPTPAGGLPPMASPTPVYAPPPSAPENRTVQAYAIPASTLVKYQNVKVRSPRHIAPCAVPMQVAVPDPCNPCCQVCVEICVPPCAVAEIKCRRCGTGIAYDFGKYEVEIKQRGELLIVDYDR